MDVPLHVLIVDRDRAVRSRVKALIPASCAVVEVDHERAALAAFATALDGKPFDLVFLSRDMTTTGELQTTDVFRAIEAWKGIPDVLGTTVVLTPVNSQLSAVVGREVLGRSRGDNFAAVRLPEKRLPVVRNDAGG